MVIQFPIGEVWDGNADVVAFPAEVDGKRIRCAISWEALQDNFGGDQIEPLECFRASRDVIESKAATFIAKGRLESDGSVLIRSSDGP